MMIPSVQGMFAVYSRLKLIITEKEQLLQRRISQTEIAAATGLDQNTISRWMSPKPLENISGKVLVQLCKYLDCEVGDLLHIERLNG